MTINSEVKKMNTATTRTGKMVASQTATGVGSELSQTTILTVGGVSVLIGLWAVACFAGGLVASGGPISMFRQWFQAVSGM